MSCGEELVSRFGSTVAFHTRCILLTLKEVWRSSGVSLYGEYLWRITGWSVTWFVNIASRPAPLHLLNDLYTLWVTLHGLCIDLVWAYVGRTYSDFRERWTKLVYSHANGPRGYCRIHTSTQNWNTSYSSNVRVHKVLHLASRWHQSSGRFVI